MYVALKEQFPMSTPAAALMLQDRFIDETQCNINIEQSFRYFMILLITYVILAESIGAKCGESVSQFGVNCMTIGVGADALELGRCVTPVRFAIEVVGFLIGVIW
jgi:hypothetical protein